MTNFTDIHIMKMSTAAVSGSYLLRYGDRYFEANERVVDLLRTLQTYPDVESSVTVYIEKCNGRYTSEQVRDFINKAIMPILSTSDKKKQRQFLYEKELLTASSVDQVSDVLSILFNRWIMTAVIIITLVADIYFMATSSGMRRVHGNVNVYLIFGLLLFLFASSFFHELGHAAACKRFGIRHGGIGFGMYLTFPVLYTDVTQAWELRRCKRLVVNIAGIYFQFFILTAILCGYFITSNDILRYLALAMNLGFLLAMNPFFRFDGYWIATDLLGVPNLRLHSRTLAKYLWQRIRGKHIIEKPYLLRIVGWEKWGLAVYSVAVTLFMGYYFCYIIPIFVYEFIKTFPTVAEEALKYAASGVTPPFAIMHNIFGQLLFLAMIGYMLYGLSRPYIRRNRHP